MAFSGMINLKSGLLTLGGQFDAYKRGQLERNIQQHQQSRNTISLFHRPSGIVPAFG